MSKETCFKVGDLSVIQESWPRIWNGWILDEVSTKNLLESGNLSAIQKTIQVGGTVFVGQIVEVVSLSRFNPIAGHIYIPSVGAFTNCLFHHVLKRLTKI